MRKEVGGEEAIDRIEKLLNAVSVAEVSTEDGLKATMYEMRDFEDALQLASAEACHADLIITRNVKDFKNVSDLPVMTPEEIIEGKIL